MEVRFLKGLISAVICFLVLFFDYTPKILAHGNENGHNHHNEKIDLGKESPVTLSVKAIKDNVDGWNLKTEVSHFKFTPEKAGKDHKTGEGHGRLYVNGRLIARLYGKWFHLSEKILIKGKNTIIVKLVANSHESLLVNGKELKEKIYLNLSK